MNYPQGAFEKADSQYRTATECGNGVKPVSPVSAALNEARSLIGECMARAQQLVGAIEPALRLQPPGSDANSMPRPVSASPLVEDIQSIIDQATRLHDLLLDARDRVTL